jgi:hypothetical protein
MEIQEIHETAKKKGITTTGKTKESLIREIQRSEGNFDCFGTAADYCDQKECCFRWICLNDARNIMQRQLYAPPAKSAPRFYNTKYLLAQMRFYK